MKRAPKKKAHTRGLEERPSWMRLAMENTRDAVFWVESSGNIAHVNAAACASLGYSKNQLTALSVFDIDPNFSRDRWPEHWKQTHKKKSFIIETVHKRKDGTTFPVDVTITTINFHGEEYHCSVARDITKRTEMEKELHERVVLAQFTAEFSKILAGEGKLRSLLQRCAQLMVETFDGAFARIWTLNEKELMLELQASAGLYTHLDGKHRKVPVGQFKIGIIAKKRKPHLTNSVTDDPHVSDREWAQREGMVAFAGYPLLVNDKVVGVIAMFARHPLAETHIQAMAAVSHVLATTIERKQAETALQRANRALRTLSECNQAIVRATSEDQLLRDVCTFIVRFGGYRMAWVGIAQNDESRSVKPVAQAGFDEVYVESADISWAETERGRGPTGTAIRECRIVTARHVQTDAQSAAWRVAALRHGYASSIALPLLINSASCMGALNIYSEEPDAFDEDEVKFLTELANDIVYGIRALWDRAAKEEGVEHVRSTAERLNLALQAANQGIYDLNLQTGEAQVSAEYATMLGYDPDDFHETNAAWIERLHPDDRETVVGVFRDYVAGTIPEYRVEFRQRTMSGSWKWILSLGKIVERDQEGRPLRMLGTHTNITERKHAEETRAELSRLLEESRNEIYIFDADTLRFLWVNSGARKNLGHTMNALTSLTPADMILDFNTQKFRELTTPLQTGKTPKVIFETRHRRKNNTLYDVEVHLQKANFEGHTAFVAIIIDITERKRTQKALQEQEQRLSQALKAARAGAWEWSIHTNQAIWSAENYSVLGIEPHSVAASYDAWLERVHPDDRVKAGHDVEAALEQRSDLNIEFRVVWPDGSVHWINDVGKVILDEGGRPVGMYGIQLDITERKLAELALRESELKFRSIFDNSVDAIGVSKMGSHVMVNPAYLKMFGYQSAEEVVGKSILNLIAPSHRTQILDYIRQRAAGKSVPKNYETRGLRRDGTEFDLDVHVSIYDLGGELFTVPILRDITERKRAEEELRVSEQKFSKAFRSSPDSVTITELETGRFIEVNDGFCEVFGYSREEAVGRTTLELGLFHNPSDRDMMVRALHKQGHVRNLELRGRHKSGSELIAMLSVERIDIAGRPHLITIARDITGHKRAEEALRKSEEKFAKAFRSSPDIIVLSSFDNGRIVDVNEKFYEATGYGSKEVIGKNTTELQLWAATGERDRYIALLRRDGQVRDLETRFRIRSGEIRDAMLSGEIIELRDGKHILGVIRDITERKRVERALRESEERFRTTLYSIGDAVITTDTEGRIMQMNRVAENMTDWMESEARGKTIQQVFLVMNEGTGEWIENPVDRVLKEGKAVGLAHRAVLVSRNGTWRPIADSASPIRNERDETIGVVLVFNDQSEQRHLQAQLMQSQKMEAVGRLAGGVAHDFNNMIGVILGYSKLMEDKLEPESSLRKNAQTITIAAERSANLTKQLLAFARKQVTKPVALNLNDSLTSLHKMFSRLIGEDITLKLNLGEGIGNIKIDPTQVDQILANLCTNARDAIENTGSIVIETSTVTIDDDFCTEHVDFVPGEYVLLTFADNGKGMNKKTLARVFEPFFTTKPKGIGTGLGLATVFGIVKQNGGYVIPVSEEGKGTTFSIYFPRYYGPTDIVAERKEIGATQGTETLLVVEDEEHLLDLARSALEHYGYKVLAARSPGEAIHICEQTRKRIDLLITDVVMPGMNGKQLKEQLDVLRPGLKTIYMSGYTADIVAHRGILDEGVHFLQKPFTPHQLAKKVRGVLDEKG